MKVIELKIDTPKHFEPFLYPHRYKIAYGGRGGGRSWTVARLLLLSAIKGKKRILCARELQTSIADSVHRLLSDQIRELGLADFFIITRHEIRSITGSVFIFKGLRHNASEIKSMEGIDICWVEEAHNVSPESWDYLTPTIRKKGSEIWVTFNPVDEDLDTYQRFIIQDQPDIVRVYSTVFDNPFAPEILLEQAESDRKSDPDRYDWVWLGNPRKLTEASIFGDKVTIKEFETPQNVDRFYYGMDFGFSQDPSVVLRSYVVANTLYIDYEAGGVGIEINELPRLMLEIPECTKWPIVADSSRPETISYLRNKGFRMQSSPKWAGSIEDGIEFLRSFDAIVIHPRCKIMVDESRWYSYKVDKATGHILPKPVDAHNHGWDALRYAYADRIRNKSKLTAPSFSAAKLGF